MPINSVKANKESEWNSKELDQIRENQGQLRQLSEVQSVGNRSSRCRDSVPRRKRRWRRERRQMRRCSRANKEGSNENKKEGGRARVRKRRLGMRGPKQAIGRSNKETHRTRYRLQLSNGHHCPHDCHRAESCWALHVRTSWGGNSVSRQRRRNPTEFIHSFIWIVFVNFQFWFWSFVGGLWLATQHGRFSYFIRLQPYDSPAVSLDFFPPNTRSRSIREPLFHADSNSGSVKPIMGPY